MPKMNKNEITTRKKLTSVSNDIKLRAEQQEDGSMRYEGYAIVFNQKTELYKGWDGNSYFEIIDRNALADADIKDVPLRYNHETNFVLARTRKKSGEGSLLLTVDDYGLKVSGEFVDMQYARDVFAMMKAEVIDQMSFAFSVSDYNYDVDTRTTTITGINKLFDVSVVDTPAYEAASISALRSKQEELQSLAELSPVVDTTSVEDNVEDVVDTANDTSVTNTLDNVDSSKQEPSQEELERSAKLDKLKLRMAKIEIQNKLKL